MRPAVLPAPQSRPPANMNLVAARLLQAEATQIPPTTSKKRPENNRFVVVLHYYG